MHFILSYMFGVLWGFATKTSGAKALLGLSSLCLPALWLFHGQRRLWGRGYLNVRFCGPAGIEDAAFWALWVLRTLVVENCARACCVVLAVRRERLSLTAKWISDKIRLEPTPDWIRSL